jgi:catechol 2,3-dioxygenase-like lactoylglutathione lyase family enzyme
MEPDLNQVDLVVRDMEATIAFYRAVGVDIPEQAIWRTSTGTHHVDITMPGGLILYFDSAALARAYDRARPRLRPPAPGSGLRVVPDLDQVATRVEEVERRARAARSRLLPGPLHVAH